MKSLVGYSLVSYILQLKDRHNGNILINHLGHIIHIDFGFMLSNSPGAVGFEMAAFKMTQEYIDILGGFKSEKFGEFRALMKNAFIALRRKVDHIVGLVEMMEHGSGLPCFTGVTTKAGIPKKENKLPHPVEQTTYPVSAALRDRFHMPLTEPQIGNMIDRLIDSSCNNVFTKLYDSFQVISYHVLV